jgi:hypothetical protein
VSSSVGACADSNWLDSADRRDASSCAGAGVRDSIAVLYCVLNNSICKRVVVGGV